MANEDQAKGSGKQIKGHLKEAAGELTGDRRMKDEGRGDRAEGKVQKNVGDAKEKIKGVIDRM